MTLQNPPSSTSTTTSSSLDHQSPVLSSSSSFSVLRLYLIFFNFFSCLCWFILLLLIFYYFLFPPSSSLHVFDFIRYPLYWTQSLALLEILHSATGAVRSPLFTNILQVGSRLFIVWGILYLVPPSQDATIGVVLAVMSWCLVEIPRYLYYSFHLLNWMPYWLHYIRYSAFLILYPTGIAGELWLIISALPFLSSHPSLLSYSLPNSLNFSFSYFYFTVIILLSYIPGSPFMFNHMRKQRKKMIPTEGDNTQTIKKKENKKE